jgi:NAD(P)H-dependent FMN reductase
VNQSEVLRNRVLVASICGSTRPGSYTRLTVQIAPQGAEEAAAQTHLIDLQDDDLFFRDGKVDESTYP